MPAAVIKLTASSGAVTGIIVADATRDYPPEIGSILVNVPDGMGVSQDWTWDSVNGFTPPPTQPSTLSPSTAMSS